VPAAGPIVSLVAVVAIAAAPLLASACGNDNTGGEATTTAPGGFSLSSPAFADGDPIPDQFAFGGDNESPPLRWSGIPAGTEELAVVVVDPDASNFIHWVVAGIDPTDTGIEAGRVPAGAVEALTSFDQPGWSGPAPPAGTRHTYVFTLYALSEPSGVTEDLAGRDAIALIEEKATARAQLRGEYETPS
jgi:Raf kinase inhibitor-like YbhB/YbcL family protein